MSCGSVTDMFSGRRSARKGKRRSGTTAAEFMAELEEDPEWVAARDARDRQLELDEAANRKRQGPLLADLAAVGVHVTDVWELGPSHGPYPSAIPVLVDHLLHSDDTDLEGIARALAVTEAALYWDQVMALFRGADPEEVRIYQGLADALSGMATRSLLPQVRDVLRDRSLGPGRIFFLRTLTRLRAHDRWEIIGEMVDDPELHAEARHLLHQRELRVAATARRGAES